MTPRIPLAVLLLLVALPATLAMRAELAPRAEGSTGDGPAPAAPVDARDPASAIDMHWRSPGDIFLAMRSDIGGSGGVGRMSHGCREIARWQTGELLDIAIDGDLAAWGVRVLETSPEDGELAKSLTSYSATGVRADVWQVPSTALRIATGRGSPDVHVLHGAEDPSAARVSVLDASHSEVRSWPVPDGPRDIALASGNQPPVVVVSALPDATGGVLTHYDKAGVETWRADLAVVPSAVTYYIRDIFVYGVVPGPIGGGGLVVRYAEDGAYVSTWPTVGLAPLDIVASYDGVRALGRAPDDPVSAVLRHYDGAGVLLSECPELPQPSQPTPVATAVCPLPTPADVTWEFPGSGKIESAPAVASDGTAYFGTLDGLMYAVDCAGRQKWVFDYREEGPEYGPQAFHGSPALDVDGTIYIGDDILVPNYFFAVNPDGSVKWIQRYETTYSQIDTSPALARDGRIFAGAHGWGAGVSSGCILVFDRDGTRHRPDGEWCGSGATGPITDSPAVLADGSAVFAVPRYHEWVLPTGTPPTATPTGTHQTPTATPVTPYPSTVTPTGAPTGTPTSTPATPPPSGTPPTRTPDVPPPAPIYLPYAGTSGYDAGTASLHGMTDDAPAQPLPPPYVTVPVPARLHQVHAAGTPDTVVDLDGYDNPSSLAADGATVWFTADAASGPALLAYDFGAATLTHAIPVTAPVAASPVLGRREPASGEIEVYLMGTDGTVVALAVSDAGAVRERWKRHIGTPATGAPALGDDGQLYVAAGQVVRALEASTGDVLWTASLDSPATSSVSLAPGGLLLVGAESGTLYAIGTSSGGLDGRAVWPSYRRDARNTGSVE